MEKHSPWGRLLTPRRTLQMQPEPQAPWEEHARLGGSQGGYGDSHGAETVKGHFDPTVVS